MQEEEEEKEEEEEEDGVGEDEDKDGDGNDEGVSFIDPLPSNDLRLVGPVLTLLVLLGLLPPPPPPLRPVLRLLRSRCCCSCCCCCWRYIEEVLAVPLPLGLKLPTPETALAGRCSLLRDGSGFRSGE